MDVLATSILPLVMMASPVSSGASTCVQVYSMELTAPAPSALGLPALKLAWLEEHRLELSLRICVSSLLRFSLDDLTALTAEVPTLKWQPPQVHLSLLAPWMGLLSRLGYVDPHVRVGVSVGTASSWAMSRGTGYAPAPTYGFSPPAVSPRLGAPSLPLPTGTYTTVRPEAPDGVFTTIRR